MEISQDTKDLIVHYQSWRRSLEPKTGTTFIAVDEVAAKVASFYEKIRGVVDWREEHLLRKTAIERILKRRFLMKTNGGSFAEPFLEELIRGGHFPNNRIEHSKIQEIQLVIDKYTYLIEHSAHIESDTSLAQWLVSIAAAEIEELLAPPMRELALIDFMSKKLQERIVLRNAQSVTEQEKNLQIYVAVQRALFKIDDATITYHLFEHSYPDWKYPANETLTRIASHLGELKERMEKILQHSLAERFYHIAEIYDTPYLLLGDILADRNNDFAELMGNPAGFEAAIQHAYGTRLHRLQKRMNRAAFYSTLSVFLTKILLVLAIEIPVDKYLTNNFEGNMVAASVLIPPVLMYLLVSTAKTTTEDNFQKVLLETTKILYATPQQDTYEVSPVRKRQGLFNIVVNALYILSFFVSYGFITALLRAYDVSYLSIGIFLLFISLIAFAGTRIRQRGEELLVGERKETSAYILTDIITIPIIQTGKWLSGKFVRYNLLVVAFNFLIEIPFQVFVQFVEHWRNFLKEKKQEIH